MLLSAPPPAGPGLNSFFQDFPTVLRDERREEVAILDLQLPLYLILFWTSWAVEEFLIHDCFFHHSVH